MRSRASVCVLKRGICVASSLGLAGSEPHTHTHTHIGTHALTITPSRVAFKLMRLDCVACCRIRLRQTSSAALQSLFQCQGSAPDVVVVVHALRSGRLVLPPGGVPLTTPVVVLLSGTDVSHTMAPSLHEGGAGAPPPVPPADVAVVAAVLNRACALVAFHRDMMAVVEAFCRAQGVGASLRRYVISQAVSVGEGRPEPGAVAGVGAGSGAVAGKQEAGLAEGALAFPGTPAGPGSEAEGSGAGLGPGLGAGPPPGVSEGTLGDGLGLGGPFGLAQRLGLGRSPPPLLFLLPCGLRPVKDPAWALEVGGPVWWALPVCPCLRQCPLSYLCSQSVSVPRAWRVLPVPLCDRVPWTAGLPGLALGGVPSAPGGGGPCT
jgi:hypothetical protein